MKYDLIVIGGGASGLMAAYSAAERAAGRDEALRVCVLEKMPRPARKVMITGKGRCNFTNVKDWGAFSVHIRAGAQFVRAAWRSLPPERLAEWFEKAGMPYVIERGDRAYPASYRASDVVDTLVRACYGVGVKIETEAEVVAVEMPGQVLAEKLAEQAETEANRQDSKEKLSYLFRVRLADGSEHVCGKVIIATGGLSYPTTGSTGDGLAWAQALGHTVTPVFPSLTALVPRGYKEIPSQAGNDGKRQGGAEAVSNDFGPYEQERATAPPAAAPATSAPVPLPHHIPRETPLTEFGQKLCGISLKNIGATLLVQGTPAGEEFGDIDFTDGGIEGPIGFQLSRKAVKSMVNGSKAALVLDLKPGVSLTELTTRVKELWEEIGRDPRSQRLREKERCRILLGKLMPWELIPAFTAANPGIITLERRGRADTKVWVNLVSIAKSLKEWRFDLEGFVGWERAVVTAGGVSTDEIVPKTMESRIVPGLYFCGEALDIDADTGGYNLQLAFCTGWLAGQNASGSITSGKNSQTCKRK